MDEGTIYGENRKGRDKSPCVFHMHNLVANKLGFTDNPSSSLARWTESLRYLRPVEYQLIRVSFPLLLWMTRYRPYQSKQER